MSALDHPLITAPEPLSYAAGIPWSKRYDDSYWGQNAIACSSQSAQAVAESQTVFIQGNQLAQRWQQMPPGSSFFIAEIGFGLGLNFLTTWNLWQQMRRPDCQLHYLAFDQRLITDSDLLAALNRLIGPSWRAQATELVQCQLPWTGGIHRIPVDLGSIWLTLCIGEAEQQLSRIVQTQPLAIDCWYLDGFKPSTNPSAWSLQLAKTIAQASHATTTVASYSAAGSVRRHLTQAGFHIKRQPGYGQKKHRIEGCLQSTKTLEAHRPHSGTKPSVLVIGAGLAGCSTARALAERGCQIQLIEAIKPAASNHPAALLRARISPGMPLAQTHWNLSGWQLSLRRLKQILPGWSPQKVSQLLPSRKSQNRAKKLIDMRQQADLWMLSGNEQWLHHLQGGVVNLPLLCASLLDHANIKRIPVQTIERVDASSNGWLATETGTQQARRFEADICVLANADASIALAPELTTQAKRYQQLYSMAGQMDEYSYATQHATHTAHTEALALCGSGCLVQAADGKLWSGGTRTAGQDLSYSSDASSVNQLRGNRLLAAWEAQSEMQSTGNFWNALRWAVADGMPIIGELQPTSGLYLNLGLGSRGLTFCFLAAEIIASDLFSEPPPLDTASILAARP
ncbi:MAG: tRNA (5-methylaminomethyl-2-thiouridine)(34)-methyltransferase MnmD [Gammaproteobacteria bacterium]